MEGQKLCFMRKVGTDGDGIITYELLFSSNPEEFWGESFGEKPCSMVNEIMPEDGCYDFSKLLKTDMEFNLILDSGCFSFQDSMDGIVALSWYYDNDGKFITAFQYGDDYDDVLEKLEKLNLKLSTR